MQYKVLIVGLLVLLGSATAVPISDGVPLSSPDNVSITVTGSTDIDLEDAYPDNTTVNVNTSDGNITFTAKGPASATINATNITGTWTNVTKIDATDHNLTINPEDKQTLTVGANISDIRFREIVTTDTKPDIVYAGPNGTNTTITVSGLGSNTEYEIVNESGTIITTKTTDATGRFTLRLNNSEHALSIQSDEIPPGSPMPATAWILLGFIGLFSTGIAGLTQTTVIQALGNGNGIAIVSGSLGVISWGIWSYGALAVEHYADTTTHIFRMPELSLLGVAFALVCAYVALTGPAEIVYERWQGTTADEI